MTAGQEYVHAVTSYFAYLSLEFGFRLLMPHINGNTFYDVAYKDQTCVISVSYENIADHLSVSVFPLRDGLLPSYDDRSSALPLHQLNVEVMPGLNEQDIALNNHCFEVFKPEDSCAVKLLKSAKELRLCLLHFPKPATF